MRTKLLAYRVQSRAAALRDLPEELGAYSTESGAISYFSDTPRSPSSKILKAKAPQLFSQYIAGRLALKHAPLHDLTLNLNLQLLSNAGPDIQIIRHEIAQKMASTRGECLCYGTSFSANMRG